MGLCASLPSGAGHQNLGNPILGLHLAHLPNSTDKYLGPFCAEVERQQSLAVLEESYWDSWGGWGGVGISWEKSQVRLSFCFSFDGKGALGLPSPAISVLNKRSWIKEWGKEERSLTRGQERRLSWRKASCAWWERTVKGFWPWGGDVPHQCCRKQPGVITLAWLLWEKRLLPPLAPHAGFPEVLAAKPVLLGGAGALGPQGTRCLPCACVVSPT